MMRTLHSWDAEQQYHCRLSLSLRFSVWKQQRPLEWNLRLLSSPSLALVMRSGGMQSSAVLAVGSAAIEQR
jgi:hypothetical protein